MSDPAGGGAMGLADGIRRGVRLLYVGQTRQGTNGADRIETLRSLGCEVTAFDARPDDVAYSALEHRLATRFNQGRPVEVLNRRLGDFVADKRFDIAWINKAVWLRPSTLRQVAGRSGVMLHFTLDSQFTDNRSHLLFRSIPIFDLIVTTKAFELEDYRRCGARDVLLVRQGYGRRIDEARDAPDDPRFDSDVTFVGHYQPHYGEVLEAVARTGIDLRIWGPGWPEFAARNDWARPVVHGDGLWGIDYARALRQAKITLCLLSKRINETATTRSMEIPAAGGFMLAERTPDHEALYEEGREAVFFSGTEELLARIDTYLGDAAARATIAAAGRARALRSGYSDRDQLARVLRTALQLTPDGAARSVISGAGTLDDGRPDGSHPASKTGSATDT